MFDNFFNFKPSETELWKERVKSIGHLKDINLKHWLDYCVFSVGWWIMLVFLITVWFVWWKLVQKSKLGEIVSYGISISFIATIMDLVGDETLLWGYPNKLIPYFPPLLFVDFGGIPVIFMLIYQYFTSWKSFTIALVINSLLLAYICEPLVEWLDIYQLINWKYTYSIPIYIFVPLLVKWLGNKIMSIQKNSR